MSDDTVKALAIVLLLYVGAIWLARDNHKDSGEG